MFCCCIFSYFGVLLVQQWREVKKMPLQHKSPETIYRGQEAYVRIDAQAFQEHGEVKITGEPIIADEVVKKVKDRKSVV